MAKKIPSTNSDVTPKTEPGKPKTCPECGADVSAAFSFCVRCGADLDSTNKPLDTVNVTGDNTIIKFMVFVMVCLIIFALVFGIFLPKMTSQPSKQYPSETTFTIDRVIQFQSDQNKQYSIDFPAVMNQSIGGVQYQFVSKSTYTPSGYNLVKNRYDADWLYWNGTLNTSDTLTIRASFTVKDEFVQFDLNQSQIGTPADVPLWMTQFLLKDEWHMTSNANTPLDRDGDGLADVFIQPSSPVIINLTKSLITNSKASNAYDIVKVLYNYVVNNIKYPTQSDLNNESIIADNMPKHALWTLRDKIGKCDEQSALFVSMVRAAGIPSWISFGALYNTETKAWGGHAWVFVYIPYKDGTGAEIAVDTTNSEFAILDTYHLSIWQDIESNENALVDYYSYLEYSPTLPSALADERYEYRSFNTSGNFVKIYDSDQTSSTIPGFEIYAVAASIPISIVIYNYNNLRNIKKNRHR